jgi:hypothetical protein
LSEAAFEFREAGVKAAWGCVGLPALAVLVAPIIFGANAFAAQGAPPTADYQGPVLIYTDASFLDGATTIDTGATIALNGDLARKGFIVELYAGLNLYDYLNSDVAGGKVDANGQH